eukprot:7077523-Pyramimonas_sp.AAC.1
MPSVTWVRKKARPQFSTAYWTALARPWVASRPGFSSPCPCLYSANHVPVCPRARCAEGIGGVIEAIPGLCEPRRPRDKTARDQLG